MAWLNAPAWWPGLFFATTPSGSDGPADPVPSLAEAARIVKQRVESVLESWK